MGSGLTSEGRGLCRPVLSFPHRQASRYFFGVSGNTTTTDKLAIRWVLVAGQRARRPPSACLAEDISRHCLCPASSDPCG